MQKPVWKQDFYCVYYRLTGQPSVIEHNRTVHDSGRVWLGQPQILNLVKTKKKKKKFNLFLFVKNKTNVLVILVLGHIPVLISSLLFTIMTILADN